MEAVAAGTLGRGAGTCWRASPHEALAPALLLHPCFLFHKKYE